MDEFSFSVEYFEVALNKTLCCCILDTASLAEFGQKPQIPLLYNLLPSFCLLSLSPTGVVCKVIELLTNCLYNAV